MSEDGTLNGYEVVVVGGGPAGAAAAITLARAGRRVLLLEQADDAAFKIGEALPPGSRPLLQELGVWDSFNADEHLPCYGNLSAWGSSHLQATDFIFDPNGHGWHLDRPRFDVALRKEAALAGAEVRTGTTLGREARRSSKDDWHLSLRREGRETTVACRWLIDATGRRSTVARRQGGRRRADDSLIGFFALFAPSEGSREDRDSRTLIEAAPDGWWYTALLPSNQRVVAYLTDADLAPRTDLPNTYDTLLSRTVHIRACLAASGYRNQSVPKVVPANSSRLDRPVDDGWMAVGDAALSFDPLSAQGIFTSLYTGMEAGRALVERLSGNSDSLADYGHRLTTIYNAYMGNRSTYYGLEGRWAGHTFWQRRGRT